MPTTVQMEPYELIVPGDSKSLSLIRMVITAIAREAGLSQDQVDKVEVAVDEACTNVIEHSYENLTPHPPVEVQVQANGKDFIVDIVDSGPSFDFHNRSRNKFPDHWLRGENMRGAGLYLMMSLMDSVDYERLPDERNRMRMVKRIS